MCSLVEIVKDVRFTVTQAVEPMEKSITKFNEKLHKISQNIKKHDKDKRRVKDDSCMSSSSSSRRVIPGIDDPLLNGSFSDSGVTRTKKHRRKSGYTSGESGGESSSDRAYSGFELQRSPRQLLTYFPCEGRLEILAVSVHAEGDTSMDHYDEHDDMALQTNKPLLPIDPVVELSKKMQKQEMGTKKEEGTKCSTCHTFVGEAKQYREHCKSDWHKHNLKRKTRKLPPLTAAEECMVVSMFLPEEQEAALKQLRKNLKFKAKPVPNFYYYEAPPAKPELKNMLCNFLASFDPSQVAKLILSRRKSFSDAVREEVPKTASNRNRHSTGTVQNKNTIAVHDSPRFRSGKETSIYLHGDSQKNTRTSNPNFKKRQSFSKYGDGRSSKTYPSYKKNRLRSPRFSDDPQKNTKTSNSNFKKHVTFTTRFSDDAHVVIICGAVTEVLRFWYGFVYFWVPAETPSRLFSNLN
uniref:TPX2 C-terminal domain-containing protein n=1 Tax=Brassica campestris TaxID=3711 RepID=A0A3P5Z577_BRACM|nr:unnamed protein product [Brassica rapa]